MAGLTGSGKTTYLAALSYLLEKPTKDQSFVMGETLEDKSYLYRLYDPWLQFRTVDRTAQGAITSTTFDLVTSKDPSSHIKLKLPDIAGEDFSSLLTGSAYVKDNLQYEPDSLLYFINGKDLAPHSLVEDLMDETNEYSSTNNPSPSAFSINSISKDVLNVLLLKELLKTFKFKRVCFIISCFDTKEEGDIPKEILSDNAPFLYNFIQYHFPQSNICGLSAQGVEYNDGDEAQQLKLLEETRNGERAYVIIEGNKYYDITLPLKNLM